MNVTDTAYVYSQTYRLGKVLGSKSFVGLFESLSFLRITELDFVSLEIVNLSKLRLYRI